eukprot:TRINITY_DN2262_c0_g2_i1.p1 TRINITY_DN2262_c0_g2~~TRINITY_DN2262_c0_g2_i1.p1  ORF type:complete len:221 (-),score=75.43 TRINITY_DN2262_c0_g2_i1:24-686(-)
MLDEEFDCLDWNESTQFGEGQDPALNDDEDGQMESMLRQASHQVMISSSHSHPAVTPKIVGKRRGPIETGPHVAMDLFPQDRLCDWKHVLYNLLVEHHNSETKSTLLQPCEVFHQGKMRIGFCLNPFLNPKKQLAELYALHIRKGELHKQVNSPIFVEDLYKFYLRAAFQLMAKYFQKVGAWTYLYEDIPLFISNETLGQAEDRLRLLETRQRKRMKKSM